MNYANKSRLWASLFGLKFLLISELPFFFLNMDSEAAVSWSLSVNWVGNVAVFRTEWCLFV